MSTQSRTVRVFLSSTFRDFAEERDLLVRKVFPELRRKCRERQVELVDVDLRWGITEEEAQNGSVLSICLAEIDRARPYFMGFIGERYGWVPEKDRYDAAVVQEQPWLEEHRGGKSVTELEMLHGVLNNPAMADRAFFYLRDAKWSGKKGGAYLSEGTQEKSKLEELKDRIRKSGFPVVENYPTPEKLAERVREDLWKLIDEAFPESEVPDALTMERRRHEGYTLSRIRLYLGGERYFTALDKAMDACKSVLIMGQSGAGKSALIANWFLDWSSKHPKAAVIVHHLGCGADAADPVRMAVRIMQEIAIVTGHEFKTESDPDKQLEQLPLWLATASAWAERENKEVLIVLDGLDKLSDREHLRWFPSFLPPQVKLVASCLDGEILEATKTRLNWVELKVKAFTKAEQSRFITEYLRRYRKKLTALQAKTLQSHPLSGNPLFLMTVLEELRVFGVHEELEQRLATLLSLPSSKAEEDEPTVDDVFEHVLARIEVDLGKKPVQQALEAIWASRAGLYQDELLAIAKLVPAQWAAIQNALDESIYESCGKINFSHDYLRKAVEDRYGLFGDAKIALHRIIAEWFSVRDIDTRVVEELPWQWKEVGDWIELKKSLLSPRIFCIGFNRNRYELLSYWLAIPDKKTLSVEYLVASEIARNEISFLRKLGEFLHLAGERSHLAKSLLLAAFKHAEESLGISDFETHRIGEQYWESLYESDLIEEADGFYQSLLIRTLEKTGEMHCGVATIYSSSGLIRKNQGRFAEALELFRRAIKIRTSLFGEFHFETLKSLSALAALHSDQGDFAEAEVLYRRVLARRVENLGANHEKTLLAASSLALLLKRSKRSIEAEGLCRNVLKRRLEIFGRSHPDTLKSLSLLASLLKDRGDFENSRKFYYEVLRVRSETLGAEHPRTLQAIHGVGVVELAAGSHVTATKFLQKAHEGRVRRLGEDHQDTIASLIALADSIAIGNIEVALTLLRAALASRERMHGAGHFKSKALASKIAKLIVNESANLD